MSLTADAPYRARDLLDALDRLGITPPPAVLDAAETWARVTSSQPVIPPATELRDKIIAGISPEELAGALLNHGLGSQLADAWRSAATLCARRVLDAAVQARNEIHAELAALAGDLIAQLEAVAAIGSTTLDTLVREGRTKEAKLFADRESVAADLRHLYAVRDNYLMPPGVRRLSMNGHDFSRWQTPDLAEQHGQAGGSLADSTVTAIRAGARLWFPSTDEAIALAQAAYDAAAAEEAERRKAQHGLGSVAAW